MIGKQVVLGVLMTRYMGVLVTDLDLSGGTP